MALVDLHFNVGLMCCYIQLAETKMSLEAFQLGLRQAF